MFCQQLEEINDTVDIMLQIHLENLLLESFLAGQNITWPNGVFGEKEVPAVGGV